MGDPAGVGPEIIAKSWVVRTLRSLPPFAMVGDAGAVARVWDGPIEVIDDIAEAPVVFDRRFRFWRSSPRETWCRARQRSPARGPR